MALNEMQAGKMYPMNWASKAVKTSTDILFSMGVNDHESVASRIRDLESIVTDMKNSCRENSSDFKEIE